MLQRGPRGRRILLFFYVFACIEPDALIGGKANGPLQQLCQQRRLAALQYDDYSALARTGEVWGVSVPQRTLCIHAGIR